MKKLLCIPKGGLNDVLCQIVRCIVYASKHNRILVIDTSESAIGLDLGYFFEPRAWIPIQFCPYQHEVAGSLTIFPKPKIEHDFSIDTIYKRPPGNIINPESGVILTFDHRLDYSEELLLHIQCGGGQFGGNFFNYFRLRKNIAADIQSKINLPPHFDAIHIRNTDMKTDYKTHLENIKPRLLNENIIIATDDFSAFSYCVSALPNHNVFILDPSIEKANGKPLHGQSDYNQETKHRFFMSSLSDLTAMVNADNLFVMKNENNGLSGFALLAEQLRNKPDLRKTFMPWNSKIPNSE